MINRITGLEMPANGRRLFPDDFVREDAGPSMPPAFGELADRVEKFIGDHPVASLAIGVAFGLFVGCLLKRR